MRASVGAALLAVLVAAPALAAKPKAGCWGYCGGPVAPSTPYFVVSGGHVKGFSAAEACLGPGGFITLGKTLAVRSSGAFSFSGKVVRNTNSGPRGKVAVSVNALFTTSTKAKVTLSITYKHCGTKHYTVRRIAA